MTEKIDPKQELNEIRRIMERSTSFISLSGLSGISAGIVGILTYFFVYSRTNYLFEENPNFATTTEGLSYLLKLLIPTACASLATAFLFVLYFSARNAKANNQPLWNKSSKQLVANLFIPLIAGGAFCISLLVHSYLDMLAPTMVVFYGLALLNASKYTLEEIRWLGITEICIGLIACFYTELGPWAWLFGFGILNCICGVVMYFKHEQS